MTEDQKKREKENHAKFIELMQKVPESINIELHECVRKFQYYAKIRGIESAQNAINQLIDQ